MARTMGMRSSHMHSRRSPGVARELELLRELEQLHSVESQLASQYRGLSGTSKRAKNSFLASLAELEIRAVRLENFLDSAAAQQAR